MIVRAFIIAISGLIAIMIAQSWYGRLASFLVCMFVIEFIYRTLRVQFMSKEEFKRLGDANELSALNEMVDQHLSGKFNHENYLSRVIRDVEQSHDLTPEVVAALKRARQALGGDS